MGGSLTGSLGIVGFAIDQQQTAKREQKRARKAQRSQAAAQAARSRRQQIRAARLKTAQSTAAAQFTGITGSSTAIGAVGGLQTQLGSSLSFLDNQLSLQKLESKSLQKAVSAQANFDLAVQAGSAAAGGF